MPGRRSATEIGARRRVALAGSVLLHAAVLVVLARFLAQTADYGEAPAIEVSLVPMPPRPSQIEREIEEAPETSDALAAAPALPARPAVREDDGAVAPRFAGEAAPGAEALAAAVRPGSRGLRGLAADCTRAGLTRDERERCEARRWTGGAAVTARLNLDPTGRYAENPEPFLSRRPTEGCRLRATGDVGPFGDDQNARAGVTCVKRF